MKAVILAAGEGTRLRPRTRELPKPLVEVAGRRILTYCFETVMDLGIEEAVVVVGYKGEEITDRYGGSYRGLALEYTYQPERTGLAYAVLAAEGYVESDFVVLNGDNIYSANLSEVLSRHAAADADIAFPVQEVPPRRAKEGAVCEFDANDDLVGLVEKPDEPPSTRVPAAFYVLPPEVFPVCRIVRPSECGEYELPDAIDLLIYSGYAVETVLFEGWRINVNTERDLERAEEKLTNEG